MDLSKIKNIVKSENKILIDYTTKIKDNIDFIKLHVEKINKERYNNVIFLFKVHYLPIQTKLILFKCKFIPLEINDNFILLLNKDNYLFLDASNIENIHPNTIINFINDDDNKNTVCNICCNESKNLSLCCRCAYNICHDCHDKINSDLCPVCKYNIGSCIKI
jgi:hypothetical protein